MNRYQLALAIFMFLGSPAWIAMLILGTLAVSLTPNAADFAQSAESLTLLIFALLMWYLPKIAGAVDVLLRKEERARFGGGWRFGLSLTLEMLFSILMTPITWLNHTIFIVGLVLGKKAGWTAQTRDDHTIALSDAVRQFWPHTLLGLVLSGLLLATHPAVLPYALIFFSGLLLSIPLAVLTSLPGLGRWMIANRLLSLPEEINPPEALLALDLKALNLLQTVRPPQQP
jgi:membrane glycosyltransferase